MDTKQYWEQLSDLYQVRDATTTWLLGYPTALELLGDLNGKTILDYGCGNGPFTRFLARTYPLARIIGVDTSETAIKNARKLLTDTFRVEYHHVASYKDISQYDFDCAVSTFVFCCIPNIDSLKGLCSAVYSQLPDGGSFVIMDPHPLSHGKRFTSFQADSAEGKKSGDLLHVRIFTNSIDVEFDDYYWSISDYKTVIEESGFTIEEILSPTAEQYEDEKLHSEREHPPYIIFKATK